MIQVPARPQAQQLAASAGLGTDLERTQAAQINASKDGTTAGTIACSAGTTTSETIIPITIR